MSTGDKCETPKDRLEYLRGELRAERISYFELAELQALLDHIDSGDTELLEAAGVPEDRDISTRAWESVAEAADTIKTDPELWAVVMHNLEVDEVGFATELLCEWHQIHPGGNTHQVGDIKLTFGEQL